MAQADGADRAGVAIDSRSAWKFRFTLFGIKFCFPAARRRSATAIASAAASVIVAASVRNPSKSLSTISNQTLVFSASGLNGLSVIGDQRRVLADDLPRVFDGRRRVGREADGERGVARAGEGQDLAVDPARRAGEHRPDPERAEAHSSGRR